MATSMYRQSITKMLIALVFVFATLGAAAQTTPRWVTKGVKELNDKRSNKSYKFVKLNTQSLDVDELKANRTLPIKAYLVENYGAKPTSIEIYESNPLPELEYKILYTGDDDEVYSVEARLVDDYTEFDDYELNVFQFEFYQLYAISEPNVTPLFDNYSLTTEYHGMTPVLSFIPGLAQLHKGQTTKAYCILGGEVALLGAAFIFDYKRHDCRKMERDDVDFAPSWASKARSWTTFEIAAFASAGALYVYNIIDGLNSKGVRQVNVKSRNAGSYYTLAPFATTEHVGMSFVLNF